MKKCPYCKEEIQDDAVKCRYCNEFLNKKADLQEDEIILSKTHPSAMMYIIFLLPLIFEPFLVYKILTKPSVNHYILSIMILLLLIVFIQKIFSKTYIITNKRVSVRTGAILGNTVDIETKHIKIINVKQNLIGKVFGFGDISISTSGTDNYDIILLAIPHPNKVKELIQKSIN